MRAIKYTIVSIILIIILHSCYEEKLVFYDDGSNSFSFQMDDRMFQKVLESRGIRYDITPVPILNYGGEEYELNKMRVRGQTTTKFQRKSFAINLDKEIIFSDDPATGYEKFKLISMVYDYTYIENSLSHRMLKWFDLWPLKTFYTQVSINGEHQGLYLFLEDPEDYFILKEGADAVVRRYYRNGITEIEMSDSAVNDSAYYAGEFLSLYKYLSDYQGQELYDRLSKKLNLSQYMRKMAVDLILKNGDYTDEISFYVKMTSGEPYFDIMPWDYDDIFSNRPHEVGRDWSVGKIFGERNYATYDDWIAEFGDLLIFSVEDDLDYAIATDSVLYNYYLQELKQVLKVVTADKITTTFNELEQDLAPFYAIPEVIEQSQYDANATSEVLFEENLSEKKNALIQRIEWLNDELSKQLN